MGVLLPGRVHVHPQHPCLRKCLVHQILDLLGAGAEFPDIPGSAFRADRHFRLFISAVMAAHRPVPVNGKRHVAVRAFYHMAALPAGNESRIAAAVQEKHGLLALRKPLRHQFHKLPAQDRTVPVL